MRIPLYHVDAFSNQPFRGNPAAVCPLNDWLDDDLLRKVAAENNLSETAFLIPDGGGYQLRWFTPLCEVNLCGHATLASGFIVLNLLHPGRETVRFKTRFSGVLTVSKHAKNFGEFFALDLPLFLPKACPNPPADLIRALGTAPYPVEVLEANETYITVYETESAVQNVRPDYSRLAQLHPFCVSITAPADDADFVSRYFAPSYGIPEDPVTGSAHCFLTPYWSQRLGKKHLYARQISQRGGELWCEMNGVRVTVKGNALLTLQGELEIPLEI